jgi:endoglucanase
LIIVTGSMRGLRRAVVLPLLVAALLSPVGCGHQRPTNGFIRVDQVGFLPGETKTAYLLSPRDATGTRVTAVDADGREVWTGKVSASRGGWNSRYGFVQPIDVTALKRAGTYRLKVDGRVAAESPPFRVGTAAALFGPLTANSVQYFRAHRDGADQRVPAHLSDRRATVYDVPSFGASGHASGPLVPVGGPVDVDGGWYDAGDYEKFTHTTAYALILMLTVQRDHPGPAGLATENRHGLDWLDKMWDGRSRTLYSQVGIGVGVATGDHYLLGDHDSWRLPQADDVPAAPGDAAYYLRYRPVFRAAAPGQPISPNLAGRVAAAFAVAAQVEAADDERLARQHLAAAADLFALADTDPASALVTSQPRDFYPEDTWHDDLALAATELARAGLELHDSRAAGWERQATHWAKTVLDDQYTDTLSVYDVSALADAELGPLLTGRPVGGAETTVAALHRDLRARVAAAAARAAHDPFGAAAGTGSSDYAALELSYAATADLYRTVTGDSRYAAFATGQRGVALGANGWGTSLVVGAGTTYPRCPHDQIADLSPDRPEPTGAVVNGPNHASRVRQVLAETRPSPCTHAADFAEFNRRDSEYTDDAGDSANTEPAIDFTATGLFAFALAAGRP